MLGVGSGSGGGGGGYTGIGDLSVPGTPLAYWGGDCYTKTGTYSIFQVNDTTTSKTTIVQCAVGAYSVVGGNDSLATIETNCGGSSTACLVTYAYDQSQSNRCGAGASACDAQQATAANQPYLLYSNGANCGAITAGLFCFSFTHGANDYLQYVNIFPTTSQPANMAVLEKYPGGNEEIFSAAGPSELDFNTDFYAYAGVTYVDGGTPSTSNWSTGFAAFNNAGTSLTQSNQLTGSTTSQGTAAPFGDFYIGVGEGTYWTGSFGALFITTGTAWTTTNTASIYANWKGRWGGGLP